MTEKTKDWRTVSLPRVLIELAEEMIKSKKYGYRNVPEYISDLIRTDLTKKGYIRA